MDGLTLAIFLILAPFMFYALRAYHRAQGEHLKTFATQLEEGSYHLPSGFFAGLNGARVQGGWEGRQVSLRVETRGQGKQKRAWAIFSLAITQPAVAFTVRETNLLDRVSRWLGEDAVKTGSPRLDRQLALGGIGEEGARRLFRSGALEQALTHAFGALMNAHTIRLEEDRIVLERPLGIRPLDPKNNQRTFAAMDRIARACERREVEGELRVVARATTEDGPALTVRATSRYGWTEGGAEVLCPYCRDHLDPAGDEAGDCGDCGTVHHRACLEEAGGCTVLGCRSAPQRQRA